MIVADRRLWLTADRSRVVEDGDPSAAFLLAAPGTEIPVDEAARLGLAEKDGKVVIPGGKKGGEAKAAAAPEQPKKGKREK